MGGPARRNAAPVPGRSDGGLHGLGLRLRREPEQRRHLDGAARGRLSPPADDQQGFRRLARVEPRREAPRVHLEARGGRRGAALRDLDGRRRARAVDRDAARRDKPGLGGRQADRFRFSRHRRSGEPGRHEKGARGPREKQGQGARHRKPAVPVLGPVADRRRVPAHLRRGRRDAEGDGPSARLEAPVRPAGGHSRASTSRPTARGSHSRRTSRRSPIAR